MIRRRKYKGTGVQVGARELSLGEVGTSRSSLTLYM
jgi:hypothetical protein